jgi:hypothetical protein
LPPACSEGRLFTASPSPAAHGLKGLLELRPLGEHRLAVGSAEVVQVDVDRKARHVEDEEVERRAALQGDARF